MWLSSSPVRGWWPVSASVEGSSHVSRRSGGMPSWLCYRKPLLAFFTNAHSVRVGGSVGLQARRNPSCKGALPRLTRWFHIWEPGM
jgi:hypothetical protein